jgi:hypothetical protein
MSKIILKVNGSDVAMNPFVKDVFTKVIGGLVDSLDKIPEDKQKIEIVIEEEK